uniref:Protein PHLOEM PROTEIN 2-LIKE A8 n=1 Tax=Noccaea caerulescens TaxID=107243 RepID=A0A1J3IUM9_NOCCA
MAASSSSSGMGLRTTRPQVFINFRGEELRRGFIGFLEPALKNENINVFIDELELRGRDLQNLFVRIEESKIALVIFSKDYTSSEWCLDELAKIKECADQGNLDVIPIFYKVEPSAVKHLQGYLGETFMNKKNRYKDQPERIRKWEEALASVPQKFGLSLSENSDRSENQFIRSIIEEVQRVLANIPIRGKENRQGVFIVPARKLDITHAENPVKWTWSSIYDSFTETNIEVATLIKVYWLQITGNFHTRNLTPGTKYEVVFLMNLEETAFGWEEPVTLKLKLTARDGTESLQERILRLDDYIGENWVDIQVGEFEVPPKNDAAKMFFSLHQYVTDDRKNGLIVKGAAIRPIDQVNT